MPEPLAPRPQRAMILAAGLGTRLQPLTHHLPKPLVPVLDCPLLEIVVRRLKSAGITDIVLNSHHLPEALNGCVEDIYGKLDGAINFQIFHEPEILGTGGGLANARSTLARDACFVLHNGDVLTDLDLVALCDRNGDEGRSSRCAHPGHRWQESRQRRWRFHLRFFTMRSSFFSPGSKS